MAAALTCRYCGRGLEPDFDGAPAWLDDDDTSYFCPDTDGEQWHEPVTACPLPRMTRPCGGPQPCPWRRDAPPGQFPPERWEALRATSRRPDLHGATDAPLGSPMFACHATPPDAPRVCAGWLAVAGWGHIGIRLAVLTGALPEDATVPAEDWPALYGSYGELAAANGAPAPRAALDKGEE